MQIEHAIIINSSLDNVWGVLINISCWNEWNTIAHNVTSSTKHLSKGRHFEFCIRPFALPINIKPVVNEIIPGQYLVWSGSKYGIRARHEFDFEQLINGVRVTSREVFEGRGLASLLIKLSNKRLNKLSILMLRQLKDAAEGDQSS